MRRLPLPSHAGFSLLRRRHHCRLCGRVACAACTAHRLTGQRVCLPCLTQALQLPSHQHHPLPAGPLHLAPLPPPTLPPDDYRALPVAGCLIARSDLVRVILVPF